VSMDHAFLSDLNPADVDLHDAQQVKEYFASLERNYPQVIEAIKVMGISYQQYLTAMRSLSPHSSFSSNHTEISL
jgi:short-subunit dehydrogenase involved in D-alanine esterification of teichoic acids